MDIEIYGASAVVLIIALVQLAKGVGFPAKFAGLLAAGLGIIMSVVYTLFGETDLFRAVIIGLAVGLSASGLYSATKNATEKENRIPIGL